MSNDASTPAAPTLPPRKSVMDGAIVIQNARYVGQSAGPSRTAASSGSLTQHRDGVAPPILPPRQHQLRETARVSVHEIPKAETVASIVLESMPSFDDETAARATAPVQESVAVSVTPATPLPSAPQSPISDTSPPPPLPLRPSPTVAQRIDKAENDSAARRPSELQPPETVPARLAVLDPKGSSVPVSPPPPISESPTLGTTMPTIPDALTAAAIDLPPTAWMILTLAVATLAYYRMLSLWVIFAGIGSLGLMQPKKGRSDQVDVEAGDVGLLGRFQGDSKAAVGWVNHALYALFPLVSTDVLTPFIDLLEDALLQQVPPIVTSVRLEAPALGDQPLLLTSLRPMSDEEWFASVSTPSPDAKDPGQVHPLIPGAGKGHQTGGSGKSGADGLKHAGPSGAGWGSKGHKKSVPLASVSLGRSGSGRNKDDSGKLDAGVTPGGDGSSPGRRDRSHSSSSVASQVSDTVIKEETNRRRKRDRILRGVQKRSTKPSTDANLPTTRASPNHDSDETKPLMASNSLQQEDVQALDEDDPLAGQYVNYQVGFQYQRRDAKKGYGLHVLGYFGVGVKNIGSTEFPVYIDVLSLKGTLNLRLLLSATPPFARTATISFPRLPEFDISAKPLTRSTFNAMQLPGMKPYDVARTFVRPKSYTLDVDRLLLGREAAYRTSSIGVLHIIIHEAEGLPKVDTVGTCDPYVAISYAKYHKPTYLTVFSTRTIIDNQNPSWEEPAFVLVTQDEIESGERLRLRICDSDRFSADDAVGVVEVELADLIEQTTDLTEPQRRRDELEADRPGMRVSGSLTWSVRFAPLWVMPPEELERRRQQLHKARVGECTDPPPWWMSWVERFVGEKPDWESRRAERRKETLSWFTGERERDEMEASSTIREHPLPLKGITTAVSQGVSQDLTRLDLEVESLDGTYSNTTSARKSAAGGKPALGDIIDRTPIENPDPPSAYVEVHLNDRLVYRTRTKQVTPLPYFNAVGERFLRDWRMAKLVFVVRDERDREHDPILGIVTMRLEEAFRERSQFTRWYPLIGGLGWGRIRISLLWRPIDIHLPPRISAFEVSTLIIKGISASNLNHLADKRGISILLETEADKFTLAPDPNDTSGGGATPTKRNSIAGRKSISSAFRTSPRSARYSTSSIPLSPNASSSLQLPRDFNPDQIMVDHGEVEWDISKPIRLAVEYRHSCNVLISFITRSGVMRKKRVVGLASVRLNDVEDFQDIDRTAPIFATSSVRDVIVATQAYQDVQIGINNLARVPTKDIPLIGFVSLDFVLQPGVSRAHRRLAKKDLRFKRVYEAWELDREVRKGWDNLGTKDVMRETAGLRDASDGEEESSGEDSDSDAEVDGEGKVDGGGVNRTPSGKSTRSTSSKGDLEGSDDEQRGLFSERRAHSHALHKRESLLIPQHKGVFQLKVARTGKFVKDLVEAKLYARATDRRVRGADLDVEREGQSKL